MAKHPAQPLETDHEGIIRFKENQIVIHLLNTHPSCNLNTLAYMEFSDEDRQQFAQLIGYSLSGFGDLSYVDDAAFEYAQSAGTEEELRDRFAVQAMLMKAAARGDSMTLEEMAAWCYQMADAMLVARDA